MSQLNQIYRTGLSLLTDLYQLTMASGYWETGTSERQAVFHLYFRKNPFQGGFTVAAGLQSVIDFVSDFGFTSEDCGYLAELKGNDGNRLFSAEFLDYLKDLKLTCDIDGVAEGTVVFPHQPLLRVKGPILQCQILETALLNLVNFQSLVATKAARIKGIAGDDQVLEFGLRRAQGIDGSLSASRAAYVGGCDATSNVLAGKIFGIPVKGTHAHSWVMSFEDELTAFEQYAAAMPNNCVFLVDTYDTLEGVKNAIRAGEKLRDQGHQLAGIRLDSGDLAYLSIEARKMLDDAGFENAVIVASNDLDEETISSLKSQGSQIAVWGVGTRLATAYDQPALGGVYKLGAMQDEQGNWEPKIKLSEQAIKTSNPGILQTRRYFDSGLATADLIYDQTVPLSDELYIVDPLDNTRMRKVQPDWEHKDLLEPVTRQGKVVFEAEPLDEIRNRALNQVQQFHPAIRRLANPHEYPVGLEKSLQERKTSLILKARGLDPRAK